MSMNTHLKEIKFGNLIFRKSRNWYFMIDTTTNKSKIINSDCFRLIEELIELKADINNIK